MKQWWSINYVNVKYKHQSNNNEIKHQWLTSFEDQWTSMKQPYQVHSKLMDFLCGRTLLPTGLWFQVDPGFQHFKDAQYMGFAGIGEAGTMPEPCVFDVCISLHWTGNHLRMIGSFLTFELIESEWKDGTVASRNPISMYQYVSACINIWLFP